ncbi:unnamed protein product, partial [Rotaria sordida]
FAEQTLFMKKISQHLNIDSTEHKMEINIDNKMNLEVHNFHHHYVKLRENEKAVSAIPCGIKNVKHDESIVTN